MYCIQCGVKLADSESSCPLCGTVVYHPDVQRGEARPLYPKNRRPKIRAGSGAVNGTILILYFLPMVVCSLADFQFDKRLDWFGFVCGALVLSYVGMALPLWFRRPNPVIFVPSTFAAAVLYLHYVNFAVGGNWFFTLAFPMAGGFCVIASTVVTLFRYVRRGRLYVLGGATIAIGGMMLLLEFLISRTFAIPMYYWSVFPLAGLALCGGALIYLAINRSARAVMERKFFV